MISLKSVCLSRGSFQLPSVSFEAFEGGYSALLGPSGSGKTSILEAIAGLVSIDNGDVELRGKTVAALPPAERMLGYVPQDIVLFQRLTVEKNLTFPKVIRNLSRQEQRLRIESVAERLELLPLLHQKASTLSRGQAQRVAIGRVLVMRPDVIILDEPCSSLDPVATDAVLSVMMNHHTHHRPTILHAAHDQSQLPKIAKVVYEL